MHGREFDNRAGGGALARPPRDCSVRRIRGLPIRNSSDFGRDRPFPGPVLSCVAENRSRPDCSGASFGLRSWQKTRMPAPDSHLEAARPADG